MGAYTDALRCADKSVQAGTVDRRVPAVFSRDRRPWAEFARRIIITRTTGVGACEREPGVFIFPFERGSTRSNGEHLIGRALIVVRKEHTGDEEVP